LDSKLIVGSGLKEAIRDMGLMEDLVRDEACEKGIIKGGGIRKNDKADVAIFRGIKLNEVPAWADYGRGRGARGARGGQGLREHVEVEAEAEAVTTAAVEPEEDRAHGEHEPEAEAEAEAIAV
jgi:hypothetical protein